MSVKELLYNTWNLKWVIGATVVTVVLSILTVTVDYGEGTFVAIPLLVSGVLGTFLCACLATESVIDDYKFAGIGMLLTTAMGFLVTNMLSQTNHSLELLLKRSEHYHVNGGGVLLVMGASAIVFGFLDNYGMKLGTDALEDGLFWEIARPNDVIRSKANLENLNSYLNPDIKTNEEFEQAAETLFAGFTREYTYDDYKRYKAIKDAGSMMGNTFSDFVGALLGAGVNKLFEYLTGILDDKTDDPGYRVLAHPVTKVVLEATFIALGCMVPVGMHFWKESKKLNGKVPWMTGSKVLVLSSAAIVWGLVLSQMAVQLNGNNKPVDPNFATKSSEEERMQIGMSGLGVMVGLLVLMFIGYGRITKPTPVDVLARPVQSSSINGHLLPSTLQTPTTKKAD